jgi:hypothetical protein
MCTSREEGASQVAAYPLNIQDIHAKILQLFFKYRNCGLVVRVLGYRSGGPGSIPGTTKKK